MKFFTCREPYACMPCRGLPKAEPRLSRSRRFFSPSAMASSTKGLDGRRPKFLNIRNFSIKKSLLFNQTDKLLHYFFYSLMWNHSKSIIKVFCYLWLWLWSIAEGRSLCYLQLWLRPKNPPSVDLWKRLWVAISNHFSGNSSQFSMEKWGLPNAPFLILIFCQISDDKFKFFYGTNFQKSRQIPY